jgi:hypothetical protein
MIGINPRPLSPEKRRDGHISNLVDLKNNNLIPSKSYGYTAGAKYSTNLDFDMTRLITI